MGTAKITPVVLQVISQRKVSTIYRIHIYAQIFKTVKLGDLTKLL